jgi:hypothetical protein
MYSTTKLFMPASCNGEDFFEFTNLFGKKNLEKAKTTCSENIIDF